MRIGTVTLRVRNLDRSLEFYEGVLGLSSRTGAEGAALFASGDDRPLVRLIHRPNAARPPQRALGLYHFALLVPSRRDLGRVLLQLHERSWPLHGASDHAVSEALYLADPDGHGIEIYADRPREAWTFGRSGELYMTTEPLDIASLISEGVEEGSAGLPSGTTVGHMHLHVSNLSRAEKFYAGTIGFDIMVRSYPGALFLSSEGYHHHLGVNTWAGSGAELPSADQVGLESFEIIFDGRDELSAVVAPNGAEQLSGSAWQMADPDGNAVVLRTT